MKIFSGTVILITGGTSSFGSWVARHLLKQKPAQIRIYSRDEKKLRAWYELSKPAAPSRQGKAEAAALARLSSV
jgi:FlaA1/EpsC-like NDP-sugar epimerase